MEEVNSGHVRHYAKPQSEARASLWVVGAVNSFGRNRGGTKPLGEPWCRKTLAYQVMEDTERVDGLHVIGQPCFIYICPCGLHRLGPLSFERSITTESL